VMLCFVLFPMNLLNVSGPSLVYYMIVRFTSTYVISGPSLVYYMIVRFTSTYVISAYHH